MTITPAAHDRLVALLRKAPAGAGLRFTGAVGTCRGSTPRLEVRREGDPGDQSVEVAGIRFFVPAAQESRFADANLDYDPALFGRGLNLRWPHREGCACEKEGVDE